MVAPLKFEMSIYPTLCNGYNHLSIRSLKLVYTCISKKGPRALGQIDGLVKKKRNSSALAMELRLSCTNPSIYGINPVD